MTNSHTTDVTRAVTSHSTYAAPFRVDELPRGRSAWRSLAGLVDPAVVAAQVALRTAGVPADPTYDDFFRAS
ncbi:hypothetical protein [Curtobacterium luteum]|uniref:hypothetical protein n=1 Tax=Curtobacterium luteum TaxID=33881 RepID=UPI00381C34AA